MAYHPKTSTEAQNSEMLCLGREPQNDPGPTKPKNGTENQNPKQTNPKRKTQKHEQHVNASSYLFKEMGLRRCL